MTFLIDDKMIVKILPDTHIEKVIRVHIPMSLVHEKSGKIWQPSVKEVEFRFLIIQNGNSFYITDNTDILSLLLEYPTKKSDLLKGNVDVYKTVLDCLMEFHKGFVKLWSRWEEKDPVYRMKGLEEMFKVIAAEITRRLCL